MWRVGEERKRKSTWRERSEEGPCMQTRWERRFSGATPTRAAANNLNAISLSLSLWFESNLCLFSSSTTLSTIHTPPLHSSPLHSSLFSISFFSHTVYHSHRWPIWGCSHRISLAFILWSISQPWRLSKLLCHAIRTSSHHLGRSQ